MAYFLPVREQGHVLLYSESMMRETRVRRYFLPKIQGFSQQTRWFTPL
jgi:hypothetical protein